MDLAECEAAGLTSEEAIALSVQNSMIAEAFEVNGELAAIWGFGIRSFVDAQKAYAWLLTTEVVQRNRITFARMSQTIMRELMTQFREVEACVDNRYIAARDWLKWLGFKEVGPGPIPGFIVVRRGA